MKRFILIPIAILLFCTSVSGQQKEQTVYGTVLDKTTHEPLPGVVITLTIGAEQQYSSTNEKGGFEFKNVPVGRCNIIASMVGFQPFAQNNIVVSSGKETNLEISMEEMLHELGEIIVTPELEKEGSLNRMVTTSVRMLSSEEANKYAGSWGDPARMVANLAGVAAADDSRNDIIVRGNSPSGLLWRIDGFNIPNPNHFGALGGTGGPVSMINSNLLSNSDFYTGAFPAEFGNVTSGIFDLQLRNGNYRKHEFLVAGGWSGLELGAEGPISKKNESSYIVNARYSFLDILDAMGFSMGGTEGSVPKYKDLSAKINIPTKKGNFSFVTLLGNSKIHQIPDMEDEEEDWKPGDKGEDMLMRSNQLFTGANYTHRFSPNTRLENRISYQHFGTKTDEDFIEYPSLDRERNATRNNSEGQFSVDLVLNQRIDNKNLLRAGIDGRLYMSKVYDKYRGEILHDTRKNSTLAGSFIQWRHRFTDKLSAVTGIHGQFYTLGNDHSIEPRIGLKWDASSRSSFNIGAGMYSQIQPRQVYFYQKDNKLVNDKLEASKSLQTVLGYNLKLGNDMHLKTEVYYQHLYNIPVMPEISQESILNFGDDFYNNWDYLFVNEGKGRNYGIEVTFEKFFSKHYYFLLTGSLYNSKDLCKTSLSSIHIIFLFYLAIFYSLSDIWSHYFRVFPINTPLEASPLPLNSLF